MNDEEGLSFACNAIERVGSNEIWECIYTCMIQCQGQSPWRSPKLRNGFPDWFNNERDRLKGTKKICALKRVSSSNGHPLPSTHTAMRPFSPLSRKPLLAIAFIAVFVFLYNVASHPRVTQTMQPTAYYNKYDERVCLPQRSLKLYPPANKANAAFVILVRNR